MKKISDTFTGRFNQQLIFVLTDVLRQKIEALPDVGKVGFLFGQLQPPLGQKGLDGRFNLLFKQGWVRTGNHKIVGVTDQVYMVRVDAALGFLAAPIFDAACLANGCLQAIQNHISQAGGDDRALWASRLGGKKLLLFKESCFEPLL